jgi:hypothetical protein
VDAVAKDASTDTDENDGADTRDEPGDDNDLDGAGEGSARARTPALRPTLDRISQAFSRTPSAKPTSGGRAEAPEEKLTGAELKAKVSQVDDRERKIGYAGAALGVVVSLASLVPYIVNPKLGAKTTRATSKTCPVNHDYRVVHHVAECVAVISSRSALLATLAVLLVFSIAIGVATRIGRRSFVAFAALMTGLAFFTVLPLFGVPYLAGGGWLLVRAWRAQQNGSPTAKRPVDGNAGSRSASRTSGAKTSTTPASGKRGKGGAPKEPVGKQAPTANKRYTPKAPPKKKVPKPEPD